MGMLTAADKAWMNATTVQVIEDWGTTCSVKRLIRNGTTNQLSLEAGTHIASASIYIAPATYDNAESQSAPMGKLFTGFMVHYAVPSLIQDGDIVTVAAGTTYKILGIQDFASHLQLLLETYIPDQNT
jgi:hypothetical protein